jgi:hypothetical protein
MTLLGCQTKNPQMKKSHILFLGIFLLLNGCILLNPKDKNNKLLESNNFRNKDFTHPYLKENLVYEAVDSIDSKEYIKFLIFSNGFYINSGYYPNGGVDNLEKFNYNKFFCCYGRYFTEDDTLVLIQKNHYAINQRKGILGSYWGTFTVGYKGIIDSNGVQSIKIYEIDSIITENGYNYESNRYKPTTINFIVDTLRIKKLLKRD